jgi:hypothetical protein
MTPADIERRIREIDWPASSPALRARVVAEAASVAAVAQWSDRLWFSRTFRWSAAAAVVVLLAIASRPGPNVDASHAGGPAAAEAEAVRIAAIDAGLPEDAAAALAQRSGRTRGPANLRPVDLIELVKTDGGF